VSASAPLPVSAVEVTHSAKRARTVPDRFAQLPTSRGHRAPKPVTPAEKQEKKVQRLVQQCASLKQRAETAEHSLKSSVAKQRKQLQKSKDTERATILSTVARICERSRRQVPLRDATEQQSKQELVQDQRTLSEAWECIRSPTDARQSAQSMESAQAIDHYNRHAAFGRKMSLRARFICGVLAGRFWDGTNPGGAKQERERVDAATASNFEKWCAAGHLHTSMKARLCFVYCSSFSACRCCSRKSGLRWSATSFPAFCAWRRPSSRGRSSPNTRRRGWTLSAKRHRSPVRLLRPLFCCWRQPSSLTASPV